MTGTRAVIAAMGALLLGVTACSGSDPEPHVAPPSSSAPSSPSTSPSSSETAPTMPAEARGTDAAAAEAFVKFYWDTVNYAQATGDVDALSRLASDRCAACSAGVDSLRKVFDRGGHIEGGEGRVSIQRTTQLQQSDRTVVEFEVASQKQLVDYPGARNDQTVPAGAVSLRAVLEPHTAGWALIYWGEQ